MKANTKGGIYVRRNLKKRMILPSALLLMVSVQGAGSIDEVHSATPGPTENVEVDPTTFNKYIPSPYTVEEGESITDEYFEPIYYENENGPTIGTTSLGVIYENGLYFKDSNNNQKLDIYEDWRVGSEKRAEDAVDQMSIEQKAGYIFNLMALGPAVEDSEEIYDEDGNVIFSNVLPSTEDEDGEIIDPLEEIKNNARASVLRSEPDPDVLALFNNAMGQLAEYDSLTNNEIALPHTMISNPTNYAGDEAIYTTYDENESNTFAKYPSSLGLAAAVMGDVQNGGDYSLITDFAENSRKEWNATGIDAMYGPQVDLATDPRWPRNYETFGEHEDVVANITHELVAGYQQGTEGVNNGGVALTLKHFPGDGASENGFESHSKSGEWRLYPTEGSLENYQLRPFQAAIDADIASMMPGYSRPADDARSVAQSVYGHEIEVEEEANVYNHEIITILLRDVMGFDGYVNSDSGVISAEPNDGEADPYFSTKNFGVEDLNPTEAIAELIASGTDVISGDYIPEYVVEAVETGLLAEEDLGRAVQNRLETTLDMGRFENPYRDPEEAVQISQETTNNPEVYEAHLKSIALMKNSEGTLPMQDASSKVYVEYFGSGEEAEEGEEEQPTDQEIRQNIAEEFAVRGFEVVDDYNQADYAYLMVDPRDVNLADPHLGEIDLVSDKEIPERNIPESQDYTGESVSYTNVRDIDKIQEISEGVRNNGGKVVAGIDNSSPWILSNLEPYTDALIGVHGSYLDAQLDVLTGEYNPTSSLPMTMVSSNEAIALEEQEIDGEVYEVGVSPNDIPGYAKDEYMDDEVLEQLPGQSYAYVDSEGNYYQSGFGLSYNE